MPDQPAHACILTLAFLGLYGYGIFVGFKLSAGDAKQWFDNWKRAFDNALKSGANIADNALVLLGEG